VVEKSSALQSWARVLCGRPPTAVSQSVESIAFVIAVFDRFARTFRGLDSGPAGRNPEIEDLLPCHAKYVTGIVKR
jgi:hypothetical protein